PDGSTVTAEDNGRIRRWSTTGEEIASTQVGESLSLARFNEDGTLLVIGSVSRPTSSTGMPAQEISIVELAPDGTTRVVAKWPGYPVAASIDRQGRRAIIAEAGGRVSLREIATGRDLQLSGHSGWVYGSTFSPDGATLATVGADGTVRFWSSDGKEQSLADLG